MKKFIISEEEKSRILKMHLNEKLNLSNSNIILTEAFDIGHKQQSTYASGSSDPAQFLDDFIKNLVAKIDANPEAKLARQKGLVCSSLIVLAGASNSWGGNATGFDRNNNMTVATPTETVLYQKNKDLAQKRATDFMSKIWAKLLPYKITKNDQLTSQKSNSVVVNTGGKNDNQRDTAKYPNPGQFIQVTMRFKTTDEIKDPSKITSIDEVTPSMVQTGSYFCNGKNSRNIAGKTDFFDEQCPKTIQNENVGKNRIAGFEIKWNPNVMKNPYTEPLVRWNFYWNEDGSKIKKITRQQYNNTYPIDKIFPPQTSVSKTDSTLIYMMGISEGNTTSSNSRYKTYVSPY
jgi:hypothetical protein